MENTSNKEKALKNSLKKILDQEQLGESHNLIKRLSAELQISCLDCAAALLLLNQDKVENENKADKEATEKVSVFPKQKLVGYRLDIGRKHQISLEQIKNVLVDVAGVDRMRIGRLDIRNYYTLVELPDGMPADIFQLLSETECNQQRLNIKRIKYQRKFYRKNRIKKAV